jgi:hypothetical protein
MLKSEKRKLIREGVLHYRKASGDIELTVFLFDHMFVMTKKKENDTYKVFRTVFFFIIHLNSQYL